MSIYIYRHTDSVSNDSILAVYVSTTGFRLNSLWALGPSPNRTTPAPERFHRRHRWCAPRRPGDWTSGEVSDEINSCLVVYLLVS